MDKSAVAIARCGADSATIYANHLAPRPEYFTTLRYANGQWKRFYAAKVKTVANQVKRVKKWDSVTIEWNAT